MPILQYKCGFGFTTERIVLSASKAANAPQLLDCTNPACTAGEPHFAVRVEFPLTGSPQFKGDGWTKKGNQ